MGCTCRRKGVDKEERSDPCPTRRLEDHVCPETKWKGFNRSGPGSWRCGNNATTRPVPRWPIIQACRQTHWLVGSWSMGRNNRKKKADFGVWIFWWERKSGFLPQLVASGFREIREFESRKWSRLGRFWYLTQRCFFCAGMTSASSSAGHNKSVTYWIYSNLSYIIKEYHPWFVFVKKTLITWSQWTRWTDIKCATHHIVVLNNVMYALSYVIRAPLWSTLALEYLPMKALQSNIKALKKHRKPQTQWTTHWKTHWMTHWLAHEMAHWI